PGAPDEKSPMDTQPRLATHIFRGFVRCFRIFRRLFDSRPPARTRREAGRSTVRLGVETFEDIFAPNSLLAARTLAAPPPLPLPREDGSSLPGSVRMARWLERAAPAGPATDAHGVALFIPPDSGTPSAGSAAPGKSANTVTFSSASGPGSAVAAA